MFLGHNKLSIYADKTSKQIIFSSEVRFERFWSFRGFSVIEQWVNISTSVVLLLNKFVFFAS